MEINKVLYHGSFLHPSDAKNKSLPEFGFIGRSNTGKSSLINMLTGHKVAKTSATPGKTQTLNYFKINDAFFLVDLPGYGYAKASKAVLKKIDHVIESYLNHGSLLRCLFILMDSRHPFTPKDEDLIIESVKNKLPISLIFTKIDKLNQSELHKLNNIIDSWCAMVFTEKPNIFFTSTVKQKGRKELLEFMEFLLKE
ncbi:MAG: ribosome biogenesis GTP-binding protein YihA/YsxC [Bacteroidia bacterium]|nr:ribosome biogenesis GTP-binding protein YihA/YsxC [Bacteroidia bacterium]